MPWNWELPDWPKFSDRISQLERQFLLSMGRELAYLKTIDEEEYKRFVVEILSQEGSKSSRIEGEILDRESLQSSIKRHFGLYIVDYKDYQSNSYAEPIRSSRKRSPNKDGSASLHPL